MNNTSKVFVVARNLFTQPYRELILVRKTPNKAVVKYREDGPEINFTLRQGGFYETGINSIYVADSLEFDVEKAESANAKWKAEKAQSDKAIQISNKIKEFLDAKIYRNQFNGDDTVLTKMEAALAILNS